MTSIDQKIRIEWRFADNGGTSFDYLSWDIDIVEVASPAPQPPSRPGKTETLSRDRGVSEMEVLERPAG
ncbi:MAG: hypothetical protein O3A87_00285 [Verrucomicrobia bacterium]|nr:hypothetical protein [Verrucomicrobiota bacterium]